MSLSSFLHLIRENTSLTRRQAWQLGAVLGLGLSGWNPLRATHVLAKSQTPIGEEVSMNLPPPMMKGNLSLEASIKERRTIRSFADRPLTVGQLSQTLWAAQGITDDGGLKRAAPSGGALYPIDVYTLVATDGVQGLPHGVYLYDPSGHSIQKIADVDATEDVAVAALRQMWIATAPVVLVLTAEYSRITVKYGDRGKRYAMIEVGHIGQNIFLQSQSLGLAAGIVGAFDDKAVATAVRARRHHEPLIIMPVGWKR
ncbi:MAG: SagB/ThcOx family dehydrogenase [Deltaproteobacteria bacterium]|jgi:SagB-type dehydrogenase family enzyme